MYSSTLAYLCFWFFIGNLVINIAAETQSAGLTRGQLSAMQSDTIGVIKKYLDEENKKASHLTKLIDAIESKTKSNKDVNLHESFDDLVERWKQAEVIMKQAHNVDLHFRVLPLTDGASLKLKGFPDERLSREVIEYIQYRLDWKLTDSKGEIPRIPIYTAECEDDQRMHYDGKRRPALPHSLYFVADRDSEEPSNNDGFQALTKAVASTPCIFYIAESSSAGAGRGVFAKADLSPGMIIGPYDGLFATIMSKDWEQPPLGSAGWTYVEGFIDRYKWIRMTQMVALKASKRGPVMEVEIRSEGFEHTQRKLRLLRLGLVAGSASTGVSYTGSLGLASVPVPVGHPTTTGALRRVSTASNTPFLDRWCVFDGR